MKQLYLIFALIMGLTQSVSAKNSADSLELAYPNLSVEEKIKLYNDHLSMQSAEENAYYHGLINQLNNSFQAKAIQTRYSKTFTLIYSVLIVVLCVFFIIITMAVRRIFVLYRIEKQNRKKIQEL